MHGHLDILLLEEAVCVISVIDLALPVERVKVRSLNDNAVAALVQAIVRLQLRNDRSVVVPIFYGLQ